MGSTDDSKSFTLFTSSPFDGVKGLRWHLFAQAFKAGAAADFIGEDDESMWEACTDVDTGGNAVGATAMPTAAAALAKAIRMRKKRQAKAYKFVYKHVDDERIKELLDALPMDDRRGAEAWALLESQCKPDQDDLAHMTIRGEWTSATIEKDVGYSVNTITEWQRLLVGINAKLPPGEKYSENELTLKFLSGITQPESLASKAVQEISAPLGGARSFTKMVGGVEQRDYKKCWEWYDTNFRGMHKQGLIRDRPKGRAGAATALHVDQPDDDAHAIDFGSEEYAMWVARGRGGRGFKGGGGRPGRGGRGWRPYQPQSQGSSQSSSQGSSQQGSSSQSRPRFCDACWKMMLNCSEAEKMRIVQAILCKPGRAYAVDGDVGDTGGDDGFDGSGDQPNNLGGEESNLVEEFGGLSLESNLVEVIDDDALACDVDVDVDVACACPCACACDAAMMVEEVDESTSGSAAAPATETVQMVQSTAVNGDQPNVLYDSVDVSVEEQLEAQRLIGRRWNRIQIHIYAFATFAERHGVNRNQSLWYTTCILIARDRRLNTGDWVLTKTGPWSVEYTPNKADASYMFMQQTSLSTDSSRFKEFDWVEFMDNDGEYRKLCNFAIELTAEEASIVHKQPDEFAESQYAWMGFSRVSDLRDRDLAGGLAGDLIPRVNTAIEKLRNPEFDSEMVHWAHDLAPVERANAVDVADAYEQCNTDPSDAMYCEIPPGFDACGLDSWTCGTPTYSMPYVHKYRTPGTPARAMADWLEGVIREEKVGDKVADLLARQELEKTINSIGDADAYVDKLAHATAEFGLCTMNISYQDAVRESLAVEARIEHDVCSPDFVLMLDDDAENKEPPKQNVPLHVEGKPWTVDSGATVHVVPSIYCLTKVTETDPACRLRVADNRRVKVTHQGEINVEVTATTPTGQSVKDRLVLHRVLVVESFHAKLFSTKSAKNADGIKTDLINECLVLPSGNTLSFRESATKYLFDASQAEEITYPPGADVSSMLAAEGFQWQPQIIQTRVRPVPM